MDRCAFQTENTLCIYRIVFTDPVRMSGRIAVRRTGYSVSLSFSYCCTYSVNSKAKNRRRHYAFSPRLSKKPSRITIAPGGVHGGRGRIFAAENPVFRAASLPCSFCARKSERFQQKLVGACLHSYNDTVNANAEVIIARCFRLLRGQDLKPHYFHSIRFILPFLCFSLLCPKYKCPFISGLRKVNTERLLQQWHHVFHPAAMQSLFCNKRHLLIQNRRRLTKPNFSR